VSTSPAMKCFYPRSLIKMNRTYSEGNSEKALQLSM
jgi:hypothetical protein